MPVFDYEDIQLVPNKCIVKSRQEIDTRIKFGPMTFNIPVVPANMQTVIDENLAIWLAQNGYFYIMHRFDEEERLPFVKKMHDLGLFASISVGVKPQEYQLINELAKERLTPRSQDQARRPVNLRSLASRFSGSDTTYSYLVQKLLFLSLYFKLSM